MVVTIKNSYFKLFKRNNFSISILTMFYCENLKEKKF